MSVFFKLLHLIALLLLSSQLIARTYIDYESPFHPTIGSSGMVVSQNAQSSSLGVEILDMGGNAIDAAVAVGFSLAITLPRAGNLGGGGFMLIYHKESDKTFYIDYRSASPLNTNLELLLNQTQPLDFKNLNYINTQEGYLAAATPGTVYGLLTAHEKFGKLPLKEILQPVIKIAREGILVSQDLHFAISKASQLKKDPESKRIYFKNDKPLAINSKMMRPDLANVIEVIAQNGIKGFYSGEIAQKFSDAMRANKGFIEANDLKIYEAKITQPISIEYRGSTIVTSGPPSGGGITLLTALKILENFDLKKYKKNSANTYHLLAESLRGGHNNRSHFIGDPAFYDVPLTDLLSQKRINSLSKKINFESAVPADEVKPLEIKNESRDTTHYSIIDNQGNAVSNTYTLGSSFGSGVTIPGTGILLNNQMRNFAYKYGDKSEIGRAASPGNKFKPGKRPMSTMAPVMVFNDQGNLSLITGSPGGSYIPAAILRIITGILDFDLNIGEATMLPRIHKDWPYEGLDYETVISSDTLIKLKSLGHKTILNKTIGSTQSIQVIDGIKYGYADLRRPNASVSIQID